MVADPDQADADADGIGDACDPITATNDPVVDPRMVYPNPADRYVTCQLDPALEVFKVRLLHSSGMPAAEWIIPVAPLFTIDLHQLPVGLYIVQGLDKHDQVIKIGKLVILR